MDFVRGRKKYDECPAGVSSKTFIICRSATNQFVTFFYAFTLRTSNTTTQLQRKRKEANAIGCISPRHRIQNAPLYQQNEGLWHCRGTNRFRRGKPYPTDCGHRFERFWFFYETGTAIKLLFDSNWTGSGTFLYCCAGENSAAWSHLLGR